MNRGLKKLHKTTHAGNRLCQGLRKHQRKRCEYAHCVAACKNAWQLSY